jgi:flagellar hook protein FlgE
MSLFNTLNTGASGMTVSGASLAVIGDNIANLSTTSFKRGQANFADAFPNTIGTLAGVQKLGRGAVTGSMSTTFEQGMLMGSGSSLDVALTGPGFFQVADGPDNFYTRDGHFMLDKEGWLVNGQGLNVQGYGANDGMVGAVVGDVQLDMGAFPPQATETITLDAQLKPLEAFTPADIDYQPIQPTLDGTQTTMEQASTDADYSTSITIYDSLGRPHDVVVNFEQIDADAAAGETTWIYSAVIDGGGTDLGGGVTGVDGMALEIATGALVFDQDGTLTSNVASPDPNAGWMWPAAQPYVFDWEIGLDTAGNPTDGSMMSVGSRQDDDTEAGGVVSSIQQDGFSVGDLVSLNVDPDGTIVGQYNNGEDRVMAQLAVATFSAQGGLERMGGNLYKANLTSGDPAIAAAGEGTRGSVSGYTLERSNVDLEHEFVSMIQSQRAYQANAGVIRTADETLQNLVNLV